MEVTAIGKFHDKETDETTERALTVDYDFGENCQEMIEKFGEESVFHHAKADMKVSVQGVMRISIAAGLDDEAIFTKLESEWEMPSGAPRGKDPTEKINAILGKLSAEDRAAILASLVDDDE